MRTFLKIIISAALLTSAYQLVEASQVPTSHDCELLQAAQFSDKLQDVSSLLSLGANVNARNDEEKTPLIIATEIHGNIAMLLKLMKKGAAVNAQDEFGRTALIYATLNKDHPAMKTLIKNGADVNIQDEDEKTALSYAFENTDLNAISILKASTLLPPLLEQQAAEYKQRKEETLLAQNAFEGYLETKGKAKTAGSAPADISSMLIGPYLAREYKGESK